MQPGTEDGFQPVDHQRHLIREYGREAMGVGDCCEISGLAPGVMAQTGMETSEIIKGVVQEISPIC